MKSVRLVSASVAVLLIAGGVIATKKYSHLWRGVGSVPEITADSEATKTSAPVEIGADDWPWWRGGRHNGAGTGKAVAEWSEKRNIVWKVQVPGSGHASPVVVAGRIFLATADEQEQTQSVLCFEAKTGKQLWRTVVHSGGFMTKHAKNSHASATCACDGKRIYVPFLHDNGLWVTALDLDGNIVWQTEAGPFASEHGYGSSPLVCDSLVIVSGDSFGGGFLAALNRDSGALAWRKQRPHAASNGNYASPILATTAGKKQLMLHGTGKVSSYDPASGDLLWHCNGPSQVAGNTPAFDDKHVIVSGGFPEKTVLCIRTDGNGDVTASHIAWRSTKNVAYIPSPLMADGLAYVVRDNPGLLACFDVASGKVVWSVRLRGEFSASPVLADGLLYLANETGEIFVVKAGRKFEQVAVNQLDEGTLATPAIAGGVIYHRTTHFLYCIAAGTTATE
jgi:outer membrane protein assembly factor BamB